MIGLGTIINVAAIVSGGLIGLAGKRLLSERLQVTVMQASALAVMFIGIGGALSKMLVIENGHLATNGIMMMVISLISGAVVGELFNIEEKINGLGSWLREKSKSDGDSQFLDAFMTASLTVCIGAMAVVGAIEDGMSNDYSILLAKSVLDFIIILVMASSMGMGCVFSAVPVALFQGSITLLALFIYPFMNEQAVSNISYVGNMLIFCVGVNLFFEQRFRVANMLPALVVAVIIAQFSF